MSLVVARTGRHGATHLIRSGYALETKEMYLARMPHWAGYFAMLTLLCDGLLGLGLLEAGGFECILVFI